MKEKLYLAYKNSNLFAYSFDIHTFFDYLQNYYSVHGTTEITIIQKPDYLNSEFETIQIQCPEFEISEFVDGVLLTGVEQEYWDNYLRGFYSNMEELVAKKKDTKLTRTYEEFLSYLGSEKIQKIVNGIEYDFILREYQLNQEFLNRIQDI